MKLQLNSTKTTKIYPNGFTETVSESTPSKLSVFFAALALSFIVPVAILWETIKVTTLLAVGLASATYLGNNPELLNSILGYII